MSAIESQPEKVLIERIQRGDHRAFEALFKRYYLPLTRYVWRYVSSEAIARELIQEIFADLWERRETLEITRSVRAYLYKTAKNRALNHIKRNKKKKEYETVWAHKKEIATMAGINDHEEREELNKIREMIARAVNELPLRCRMSYKLHRYDGLTYEEIADLMNVSVKAVEAQMTRSLKYLRDRLKVLLPFVWIVLLAG